MNEIVNAYIQQAGLDKTQAQQLMQELQALDETQLQQVLEKMQQQLQSAPMQQAPQQMEEEMMMQYGGKMYTNKSEYLKAKKAYDDSLTLYKQGKIDKETYLKKIESFGLNRKDQLSENSSFLKTPSNISSFNKNSKIKPIKQGHLSPIGSSSTRQPNGEYDHKISYLKNSNDEFTLEDGSSLANQIQDGYFLYKKPKQYPQFSEVQNVSFPKETFSYPEFNAPQISLPEEEMYISPKPREYTTGQESYELNDDYIRRMHEYQKGNKQAPKLIRNQYGGYEKWKKALPKNLQSTDTTLYNLRGAYEGGLIPEMTEDGLYHLGSRNPKTGELLKSPKHPTFNKMIEGEAQAGYEVYEKNGKLYSRPKSKQQYGGIPVDEDGVFSTGKNPVVVPTRGTGKISMEGVDFPIDSYDADTMQYLETMQPNQEYQFDGVNNVLEIPQAKFGIQKMQTGGNIAMDNNRLMEYEYELNEDESPLGKKYQKKLDETFDALATDKLNVKEYFKQKEKLIQEYLANKHKNDKPVNYLNSPKKFPVKVRDFKSTPASNPTSAISTPNYSGNSPVEAIGNPNLRVGDRVDTVGGTSVRDFGITNKNSSKKDEYGFVTGLKPMTTKKEMLPVYKESWVEEWSAIDPNFKNKTFAQQQAFAKNWVKTNARSYYDGLSNSFQGYNIDKLTADNKFGSITNQLRPSFAKPNSLNGEEPVPNFVDAGFPVESGNSQPTKYTGTVDNTPIALPQESKFSFEDAVNPADAIIGKLDNRDMSGRYLSNMKLRNNEIKLPYFGQVDLKTPQLYQQDIAPYVNNLYTGYNAAVQNIDMNSAVGQAQALQLNANLDKSINDVSGSVYNQNLKAAIDWENQLTGIYNQQSQLDNQNRAAYSDGVDLVRTNKQNVDNQIDALAYEHKMKQIQNQNNMMLSTLLHPDFYTTDEGNGQLVLKRKYNKAPTSTAKVAKFGMKKKAC